MELKSDPHHRVRANVLRAWLEFAGDAERIVSRGLEQIGDMLGDSREMHRVAALWLAERIAIGGGEDAVSAQVRALADRVREMVGSDPDQRVRERAVRVAARLAAQAREEWGASAADVSYAEVSL